MGLLSKIFGNDDDADLKYVLFAAFSGSLSNVDGEMTNEEVQVINNYLSSVPGMTEQRQIKIIKKANNQSEEAFKSAQALNEKDKLELIGFLVDVAFADGYFHGEEASYIIKFSVDLGFNPSQITDYVMDNFDINIDEFVEASRKRLNLADSEILAMKMHLLRKKTEKKQTNIIKLVSNLGNENSPRIDVSELEYIETTNETGNKVIRVHFNGEPFEGIGFEYFEANNQKYYMEWEYDKTMGQMVSFAEQTEYDRLNG
jgi:uncharacterized tellurite resistance protein B-like protein|tara:strand:+ start:24 stop:797 length:774 start_codon:yes stop_codon:yes gene_type:complete